MAYTHRLLDSRFAISEQSEVSPEGGPEDAQPAPSLLIDVDIVIEKDTPRSLGSLGHERPLRRQLLAVTLMVSHHQNRRHLKMLRPLYRG